MKSISIKSYHKIITTVAFFVAISFQSFVMGQTLPQISARFSNPQYVSAKGLYYVDVELSSSATPEYLFGMNVRFFYDAAKLDFKYFDQYSEGYGPLGGVPHVFQNNGQYGPQMFNFKGATAFVNGSIQALSDQSPLSIVPNQWVKVFRVCFGVPDGLKGKELCPSLIWDLKSGLGSTGGGYLIGDDGLVITVIEKDPKTPEDSKATKVTGIHFNWENNSAQGQGPAGKPVSKACILLNKLGQREDVSEEYALFQNRPNPFNHGTVIEFILPFPQEVILKFYDVSGRTLSEIKGEYREGLNAVNLDRQAWMEGSKVVFYRMETQGFKSKMCKMALLN
jgi:hypothetical protein